MITDDPVLIQKRIAYIDKVRRLYSVPRNIAFVACLVGAIILIWCARRGPGATSPMGLGAVAIIVAGWAVFVYVLMARAHFVRKHPFDPNL